MVKGDNTLEVIGVQHLATRNNVTMHVRIYVRNPQGKVLCFDAETLTFELTPLMIDDCEEMHKILGVAQ